MRRGSGRTLAGLALGLTTVLRAAAAERAPPLPSPHLGACSATTAGFLLPGTGGCLTIGGFVRAEGAWAIAAPTFALAAAPQAPPRSNGANRSLSQSALGASARLTADLRLPTELGPVRVFVSLRGHNGVATDRAGR